MCKYAFLIVMVVNASLETVIHSEHVRRRIHTAKHRDVKSQHDALRTVRARKSHVGDAR